VQNAENATNDFQHQTQQTACKCIITGVATLLLHKSTR